MSFPALTVASFLIKVSQIHSLHNHGARETVRILSKIRILGQNAHYDGMDSERINGLSLHIAVTLEMFMGYRKLMGFIYGDNITPHNPYGGE
jgi:hypothetical protein